MKVEILKIDGSINVDTGRVTVSDPGYNDDVWCLLKDVEVKKGNYIGIVYMGKEYKRPHALQIVHEDERSSVPELDLENRTFENTWTFLDSVGVDAGLMSMFKSGTKPNYEQDEWVKLCNKEFIDKDYGCIDKSIFWSTSGGGDGCYPVYAYKNNEGEIVSLAVDFLLHNDDEEEEE